MIVFDSATGFVTDFVTAAALQARRQCAHVIRQNAPRWRAVQVPLPTPSALLARGPQKVICFCFPRWQRKQGDRSVNKSQACHCSATSLTFYSSMRGGIQRHLSPGQALKPCPAVALAQISLNQPQSAQVERKRKLAARLCWRDFHFAGRVAHL